MTTGVVKRDPSLRDMVDEGMSSFQTLMSYLLLPLALPFVFLQEVVSWAKERMGLNKRQMEGRVVLITGASSGIGEALAHQFYNAGCRLILASRRKEELERVKNELLQKKVAGSRVYIPAILELDLADLSSIPGKGAAALAIYDGVDILINNAGILNSGFVLDTDLDVFKRIMDVNYFGTVALTKVIGSSMAEKKSGHIVFMSSVSGKISTPHTSAYCASKHALNAFADSFRAEVSGLGLEVTVIGPGYVRTAISDNALKADGSRLGTTSRNIATGMSPDYIAARTFKALISGEKDVVLAPFVPKLAIALRYLVPSVYFFVMRRMAKKYRKKEAKGK